MKPRKRVLMSLLAGMMIPAALCAQNAVFGHRTYNGKVTTTHADLNNDGREDLVYFTQTGFAVVLSTGDGTYGPETDYNVPDNLPAGTLTFDQNNDGRLDIIAYNWSGTGFYEYLNNGDGTFHLQATWVTSSGIEDMVAGDFNHDGYADLAFTTFDGKLQVFFNNHASGFDISTSTAVPVLTNLGVGDFDGDGKADIFASDNHHTYIYFGDNTGHFTQVNATTPQNPQVVAADIDGDGKTDLVGSASGGTNGQVVTFKQLFVIYGNAARTITLSSIPLNGYTVPTTYNNPAKNPAPDVADFNGDGHQDIALVEAQNSDGSGARSLVLLTGKGNRQFNPEQTIYVDSTLDYGVAAIRANADSKPDILVDTFANNATTAQFFMNDTSGGFFGACPLPSAAMGISVCSPATYTSTNARFSASAWGVPTMRKLEIWVDGVKKYEQLTKHDFSHYAVMDTTLSLTPGTHNVDIYSAGYDNMQQRKSYSITVQ